MCVPQLPRRRAPPREAVKGIDNRRPGPWHVSWVHGCLECHPLSDQASVHRRHSCDRSVSCRWHMPAGQQLAGGFYCPVLRGPPGQARGCVSICVATCRRVPPVHLHEVSVDLRDRGVCHRSWCGATGYPSSLESGFGANESVALSMTTGVDAVFFFVVAPSIWC